MRTGHWLCLWLMVFGVASSAAQRGADKPASAEQFVGTWTGTWEGAGSGGFELTLSKKTDGEITGGVSVTGEPTYKATFKTLSFDGNKMSATYDFPMEDRVEVVLSGTFEGKSATGTWLAREKGATSEVASGTWTVTNK